MRIARLAWMIIGAAACSPATLSDPDGGGGGDDDDGSTIDAPPGDPTCDAPALFDAGITPTRTLYVAPGAASDGDGSIGSPFRTIEQAAAVATPGTAIRLTAGIHASDQFIAQLRGTAAAPIWIGGDPSAPRPVIQGGMQSLQLQRAAYVVIHDVEIAGQSVNGINIDDGNQFDDPTAAHHIALVRVHVHDVGAAGNSDCIKVSGINDLAIYDSRIERCGAGGSGVDHVGCHRSVVARSTFDGRMVNAIQAKGGSTDVDIRQNRIRITGARAIHLGGATDSNLFRPSLSTMQPNAEARRIRAFNNVITGLGDTATPFAFVGCVDCLAAHNLVRGQQRWHARILQETVSAVPYTFEPSSNGRVIGNTFVFSAATLSVAVNVGANTSPMTFSFANNLWYATDNPMQSAPQLPTAETGGVSGMPSGYVYIPDDPNAPVGASCVGAGEAGAAAPVSEVVGTMNGQCRAAPHAIGPHGGC